MRKGSPAMIPMLSRDPSANRRAQNDRLINGGMKKTAHRFTRRSCPVISFGCEMPSMAKTVGEMS